MKASPLTLLTSRALALCLMLSTTDGGSAEPETRVIEVPGYGLAEFPKDLTAQRLEEILNTKFGFRVDPQSFKVSVVYSPKIQAAPPSPESAAQTGVAPAPSSNPITSQGATVEDWSSFVGFLSVLALVVAIVLHLWRRTTTGTKAAPASAAAVMPVQLQPLTLFVLLNGNTQGPLSQDQVLDMMQQGRLLGETPAWKEGLADWKRLDQLVSLPAAHPVTSPSPMALSVSPPKPTGYSNTSLSGNQPGPVQPAASSPSLSSQAKLRFGFLRFVRGVCGFLFGMQIVGLLPVLTWLQQPDAITGKMLALVFFKVFFLVVFGALFFWLRNVINRLYATEYGIPHPALVKQWAV